MGVHWKQTMTANGLARAPGGLIRAGLALTAGVGASNVACAATGIGSGGDALDFLATLFYAGFIAALLFHSLLQFVIGRDPRYLEHAGVAFGLGIAQLALGALHTRIPGTAASGFVADAQSAGLALAGLGAALFTRGFLQTDRLAPRFDVALRIFAGLFALALAAAFVVPDDYAVTLVAGIGPAFTLLAAVCSLQAGRGGAPGARLLVAGWAAMGANALLLLAVHTHLISGSGLVMHWLHVTAAMGLLLLSLALAERAGAKWRERAIRHAEELASAEHTIEALQASEQFLTQGMAQRNLELDGLTQRLQESEQRYQQMSHHDPLTGLANQLLLADRLDQGLIRGKRHNTRTGVIVVDLDEFHAINEGYGEDVGDEILRTVALRLRGIVREQDTVARPEDDRFVIVLEEVFDAEDLQRVANAIMATIGESMQIAGQTFILDASIGCAISTNDGSSTGLLKQAGKLMRRAKEGKRLNRHNGGLALPQG